MNKKVILAVVVIIVLVALGYGSKNPNFKKFFQKEKVLTMDEAKAKAQEFIAGNLVAPGTKVDITNISEEGGLYKLDLDVSGKKETAYISKNGQKFFLGALDIAETEKKAAESQQKEAEQNKEIPKTDKPQVDLFVMSFCPFGNKAEDTLKPAYELLKNKVDFNFHYIVSSEGDKISSLHGQPEVDQNEREACVLRDYGKDAWINFVSYVNAKCGSDGACWEVGAKNLNLDTTKISACVASNGVALMKADEKFSTEAGASGSPTMIINGTQTQAVYQYGNSESYKQAICGAFNSAPAECSQTLSAETATGAGGSCN